MPTLIGIGIIVLLCAITAAVLATRARTSREFPPVVELAKTGPLPRLALKATSLTTRTSRPASKPAPAPPPLPFLNGLPDPAIAPERATPSAFATPHPEPLPPLDPAHQGPTIVEPVYKTRTGPYAAPVVHGTRITLPDDDTDLPITFRSAHPTAQPIAEAGDAAHQINVAGPDGRIRIGSDGPVAFGPPTD